jgi:hypothetical protein
MTGMIPACFGSSRAIKPTRRSRPIIATLFASGATLFCICGAAAPPANGEASRGALPAPPPRSIKIHTNESALDLKRTEARLATYLCPIADYLAEITRKPMTSHNRFLIVWANGREEYYVQCHFLDDDNQIRCEGASVYYDAEIKDFATAAKGEVLEELGFSTDASAGNFARELRVDELGTRAIAKLIIELLARIYDLRTSDRLEYYAPLLSSKKGNPVIVDPERCPVPTSSLRRELAASPVLAGHP